MLPPEVNNAMKKLVLSFLVLIASVSAVQLFAQGIQPVSTPLNTAAAVAGPVSVPLAHTSQISSGDLLELDVFDTPELSGKLRVDEGGNVALPLAHDLPVAGLTAEQASRKIEARFREAAVLKDPHASVTVLESATQGITIMGEVRNPGVYPLVGARDLLDLISQAGGLTSQAGKDIIITHRSDLNHPITVRLGSKPGSPSGVNVDIQPGDTIVVSHEGIVYVVGDVGKPGGFRIENNDRLTVLQAIALAQGANKTAALSRAKVIRKTEAGREELPISLKKILANNAPDETLFDGDILFVPNSARKSALSSMEQVILPAAASAAIYRVP
jgi:polysaccharide export outer membrane protein